MTKPPQKNEQVELHPDAWARFERAVDVVAKSPPQHRAAKKQKGDFVGPTETKTKKARRPRGQRAK